jgi:aminoglycoside phosphotransferase (APT) family kinase protein
VVTFHIVSIYEPNLDLLRQAFGNTIDLCRVELIKVALGWSRVYRVTFQRRGRSDVASVIVKTADPRTAPTPQQAERELRYYQNLHVRLSVARPEIYHLTTDEETGFHVIVMEDLSPTHRIPAHPYQWTRSELKSILRAYAILHTSHIPPFDAPWLTPRYESALAFDEIPAQVATVQQAGIWGSLPPLDDLIAYARESCQKYASTDLCLLHGDTTPANAALPQDPDGEPAILIDWQDVGFGMPEFDLAYIDLQPFESARLIPRQELLDLYWCFRDELEADTPSLQERRERQLHADVVMTLWLTGTASRVARHPYPEGTYPHMHWASQFGIVYDRLKTLTREIA